MALATSSITPSPPPDYKVLWLETFTTDMLNLATLRVAFVLRSLHIKFTSPDVPWAHALLMDQGSLNNRSGGEERGRPQRTRSALYLRGQLRGSGGYSGANTKSFKRHNPPRLPHTHTHTETRAHSGKQHYLLLLLHGFPRSIWLLGCSHDFLFRVRTGTGAGAIDPSLMKRRCF